MSQTTVAKIQYRIEARKCAATLVVLVKLFGQQELPELKNFFPRTLTVRSSFFLADLKR